MNLSQSLRKAEAVMRYCDDNKVPLNNIYIKALSPIYKGRCDCFYLYSKDNKEHLLRDRMVNMYSIIPACFSFGQLVDSEWDVHCELGYELNINDLESTGNDNNVAQGELKELLENEQAKQREAFINAEIKNI